VIEKLKSKLSKGRLDVAFSFLIYSIGLLSILVADLYVTNHFETDRIADWAFTKSTVVLIGTICLLGYDQVFVRDVTLIKRVFKTFVLQSLVISSLSAIIICSIKGISISETMMIFVAIFLMAVITYFAAASRANFNLWKSQFSTNFWKIILLVILLSNIISSAILNFLVTLIIAVFLSCFLKGFKTKEEIKEILDDKSARSIGISFLLTNITLIFAVYGEQFLVNIYGSEEISAHLFTYFSIFTPIALSVNGFLGFYLGPKLRRNNNISLSKYMNMFWYNLIYSVVITLISIVCGILYMMLVLEVPFEAIDRALVLSLTLMCIVRGVYISTSVVLGVYGNKSFLRKMANMTWVATIIYIVIVFGILFYYHTVQAAIYIAFASTANWLARLIISHSYSLRTFKIINNG
jgi:hypothetical protein